MKYVCSCVYACMYVCTFACMHARVCMLVCVSNTHTCVRGDKATVKQATTIYLKFTGNGAIYKTSFKSPIIRN